MILRLYIFLIITITLSSPFIISAENNLAELELNSKSQLGEGALWDYKYNRLFWIDIEAKLLHVYSPKTATSEYHNMPSRIGTVVPINKEEVLVALEDGIYKYNLTLKSIKKVSDPEPDLNENRFNDGKCDPSGRFWVGSMSLVGKNKTGFLHMIDRNYSSTVKISDVSTSNGIVWHKDKSKMYYIDTPTKKVMQYDFDNSTGEISNPVVAIEIPDSLGYPDGSTIDQNGNIWIAMWGGSAVTCWDPNTGKLLDRIPVPSKNVTSCAFGGKNLDVLYITSSRKFVNKESIEQYPNSGGVFKVKPGVKGVKCFYFKE